MHDCAFPVRLALTQKHNSHKKIINNMLFAANGKYKAHFEPVEGLVGGYRLKISLLGSDPITTMEMVKPELDTRIKVYITMSDGEVVHFQGQTAEALGSDSVELLGRVQDFGNEKHPIMLNSIDDKITIDCARKPTVSMDSLPLRREEDVDIPAVIFQARPMISHDKQNAGKATAETQVTEIFRRAKHI